MQSRFLKDVATLMSATVIAQMIGLLLMPIISRIYTPEEFGVFGSFIALVNIFSAGVTLQYHQALMLPREEKDGFGLFIAAVTFTLFFSLLVAVLTSFVYTLPFDITMFPKAAWMPPLLGIAIFVNASYKSALGWSTRKKAFKYNAISRVSRSIGVFALQLSGGLLKMGSLGLIGGNTLGEALSALFLWKSVIIKDWEKYREDIHSQTLRKLTVEYRDFPFYSTPQNILNAISQGIPVLLLGHFYGIGVAGAYAFGNRILNVPMNFILEALRQVLFQRASEASHHGDDLFRIYYKTTLGLFCVALVPAIAGFILSPWLFSVVFGQSWYIAGVYARWLILWLSISFCNVPSIIFARILREQRFLLIFDIFMLIVRLSLLWIGGKFLSPLQTIILFSLVGAGFNLFIIIYIWLLTQKATQARTIS